MDKKRFILNFAIIALILLEIIVCASLAYKNTQGKNMCIAASGCDAVQESAYGKVFGIKLPFLGIFAFLILLGAFFINKNLFFAFSILGGGISVYLISVQIFILKEICSSCMLIDSSMLAITLLAVVRFFMKNK
jgi:uncharacterized membrane protein